MKRFFAIALVVSLASCHYGREEAQKTLDANELYKTDRAEFSTNRGNDAPAPEATDSAQADGTVDASAPTAAEQKTPADSTATGHEAGEHHTGHTK